MSNERLRSALLAANVSVQDLSDRLGVDPKTVERWITTGRTPHRRTRLQIAELLHQDDVFLWPETKSDPIALRAAESELVTLYPNRGAVSPDRWVSLIQSSRTQIDFLAMAGTFIHDSLPDALTLLADRARAGVTIRLLFGDPDSAAVLLRGEEEGIGTLLASRCQLSWVYFEPLLGVQNVEARQHGATLYNSLYRFDDVVLVNAHTYGAAASASPVFQFQRLAGGRLFTHYMRGFERTWDAARPVGGPHLES